MSKHQKAIDKLRRNPLHVRYKEAESILLHLGFSKRQEGTNHVTFYLEKYRITIPKRKPFIKRIYVELIIAYLDEVDDLD